MTTSVDSPDGPEAVAALIALDSGQCERFKAYVALVRKWQPAQNLVAPSTLDHLWSRHVADSVQAHLAVPEAKIWLDLGSGAGFPGLVTAILLADVPGAHVHLCESNGRKAAFLQTVARDLRLPVSVHGERIEKLAAQKAAIGPVEAISARALAAMDELLALAFPFTDGGAPCVFHKGRDFAAENALALRSWAYDLIEYPSRTDPEGRIVVVRALSRRA